MMHNRELIDCRRGHPLRGANLAITSQGKRRCRVCDAARTARYRARKRGLVS